MFQFTLPRGERLYIELGVRKVHVSIHAPARGATASQALPPRRSNCFNSRSREGSDLDGFVERYALGVSIHAPARGATTRSRVCYNLTCFNSRSREGSDFETVFVNDGVGVSIHAPARGATWEFPHTSGEANQFQFTLPRGERHDSPVYLLLDSLFQFTLPRGERLLPVLQRNGFSGFQFTLPRGERPTTRQEILRDMEVSIHAPARGATGLTTELSQLIGVSIHAPARGATGNYGWDADEYRFQFTLPRGERLRGLSPPLLVSCFNSRSREGSDYIGCYRSVQLVGFNSRSREGSDA